jgi:site-specific recombinase XerD
LIVVPQTNQWHKLKALVLDSVSSPITKRVYNLGLDEFFAWYAQEPRPGLTKATVSAWRVALEARGLGSVSINVRITAVRKLAVEAADNGLLAPELAAGISRVKGAKSKGVRVGNWLSLRQAQALLNAPDATTKKGLRDRAMLAVLLGCGLRRSEVAALTLKHIQQRDNRWCIVDLVGKHGRVRTIPMPTLRFGPFRGACRRPGRVSVAARRRRMWKMTYSWAWARTAAPRKRKTLDARVDLIMYSLRCQIINILCMGSSVC